MNCIPNNIINPYCMDWLRCCSSRSKLQKSDQTTSRSYCFFVFFFTFYWVNKQSKDLTVNGQKVCHWCCASSRKLSYNKHMRMQRKHAKKIHLASKDISNHVFGGWSRVRNVEYWCNFIKYVSHYISFALLFSYKDQITIILVEQMV